MMNPTYHFARLRELLDEFIPSRERSLAATKLDECEMWLARCQPTREALERDQAAALTVNAPAAQLSTTAVPLATAHTYTAGCDGLHPIAQPCPGVTPDGQP